MGGGRERRMNGGGKVERREGRERCMEGMGGGGRRGEGKDGKKYRVLEGEGKEEDGCLGKWSPHTNKHD